MPTLTQYRKWIAQELQGTDLCSYTSDSGATTTTTLVDTTNLKSSIAQDDLYRDYYLYVPSAAAGNQLRVVSSYAPTTGTLTVDKAVTTTSIYSAVAYELHGYIEPKTDMTLLINEALKRIYVPLVFNFAPKERVRRQDLTAQQSAWLRNPSWVRGMAMIGESGTQVQTITESGSPSGGTFALSYSGEDSADASTDLATANIAFDATDATMQTRLRTIPGLSAVTVTRTGTTTNFVWTVTMTGAPLYSPPLVWSTNGLTGGSSPSIDIEITTEMAVPRTLTGRAVHRNGRVYAELNRTFDSTDRLYVWAIKRAYDHCRQDSTGPYGETAGLAAEAYEAIPPVELVGFCALLIAARRAKGSLSQNMQDAVAKNYRIWSDNYTTEMRKYFVLKRDAPLQLEPDRWFGPDGWGLSSTSRDLMLWRP